MRITDLYENASSEYYYHGTTVKFSRFDPDIASKVKTTIHGPGYYFTNNLEYATRFMTPEGGMWKVKIRNRRIVSKDGQDFTEGDIKHINKKFNNPNEDLNYINENFRNINNYQLVDYLFSAFDRDINKTCKLLTEIGIDGLLVPAGTSKSVQSHPDIICVYSSNSILNPEFIEYDDVWDNIKK